jgi:ABC-2 type transport system ATP-binding protein
MTSVPAVDAVDVTKRYGDLVAVDAITMQVAQGEVYGVLGPNGAGKTTFLRMLFGLIRADAGTIRLFGRTREEAGTRVLDGVSGFIESPKFYPYLSGRKNLAGLARLDGGAPPERMAEVLEIVDLADRADDKVGGYSFGMRQRLGVAASLLRDPQLLVLDEPANGLDPAGIRDMRALVKRLAASGLTVLLSSHDMAEVEEICDNVTIMRTGSVVFHGQIAELREQAPEQGHRISTDDDRRALELAGGHPRLRVVATRAQPHGTGAENSDTRRLPASVVVVRDADGHTSIELELEDGTTLPVDADRAALLEQFVTPGQPGVVARVAGHAGQAGAPVDLGLVITGAQSDVDEYVTALVGAGIALRGLALSEEPLESLFFMLTESAPGGMPADLDAHAEGAVSR